MVSATKEHLIDLIRSLPDEANVEQLLGELLLRISVEQGLEELDNGVCVSHEQARERLSRWIRE